MTALSKDPQSEILPYVHYETSPVTSGITGRTILLNEHASKFAVLPGLSREAVTAAHDEWQKFVLAELASNLAKRPPGVRGVPPGLSSLGVTRIVRRLVAGCLAMKTESDFASALDGLVRHAYWPKDAPGAKGLRNRRVLQLLVVFWKHGAIAFPGGFVWRQGEPMLPDITQTFYGSLAVSLAPIFARTPEFLAVYEGSKDRDGERYVRHLFLACGRAAEVGDVDTSAVERVVRHMPRPPKGKNALLADALRALQLLAYAEAKESLRRIPPSYRPVLRAHADLNINSFNEEDDNIPCDPTWIHMQPASVTSTITGRTFFVNYDESRYAVLPNFSPQHLAADRADWESAATLLGRPKLAPSTLARIAACFQSRTVRGLAAAIERLVTHRVQKAKQYREGKLISGNLRAGHATRITEALLLLWKHDLVAFPAGEVWGAATVRFSTMGKLNEHFYGSLAPAIRTMEGSGRWGPSGRRVPRLVFLICGGVREVGDIDASVLKGLLPFAAASELKGPRQFPSSVNVLCDRIRAVQLQAYSRDETRLARVPQSYRTVFRPTEPGRSDPEFRWATALGARVTAWHASAVAYVASLPNRITRRTEISVFNGLLDYVHAHEDVPARPLDYCRRDYNPSVNFESYYRARDGSDFHITNTIRRVGRFLGWVLEEQAMDEDGYIPVEYHNPHDPDDLATTSFNRGQTHRIAIPVRYLRIMREIIEENDYAWPRSIRQDYIEWINPVTETIEAIWSPVRALFFLLRLHLPLRGMQVRLLDSGEGDLEVLRPDQGGWVPNTGRWASKTGDSKKPTGFVRRIWDHQTRKPFNGLYITTNKTADRVAGFVESGYEIPWENPEVIALFTTLRDWQENYNPSQGPMTRSELSDKALSASEDVAVRLAKLHFLFRDPANGAYPMEPISVGRLSNFWCRLIAELERRLASNGVTNHDGSPIALITKYAYGLPVGTIFDPHSLRVAGLTAFAAAGVPIHVLSEFVAGHATVLMTIYYQKLGASEVTRLLDEASLRMIELEQRQWAAFLKDQSLDIMADLAVFNSTEGAAAAAAVQSGLWSPMDDGICPNGGTKCSEGGPLIDSRRKIHSPVLGGARNCVMCRFFVTGPAFLAGLVAKFNATAGEIREAITRVHALSAKRRGLVKAQLEAERERRAFGEQRQLIRAEEELAKAESEVDVKSQTWMGQLRLIRRCEALLEKRMAEPPSAKWTNALVLNGTASDLRIALESCSEFDLWDNICESSEFFEGIDARMPALRRGRLFDAMLSREGRPALFATLTDDRIIAVGNEATRLLRTQLGNSDVNDLIAGQKTLKELGAEEMIERIVRTMSQEAVAVSLTALASPAQLLPLAAATKSCNEFPESR